MSTSDLPFNVQLELLELVAENESFIESAKALEVLSPDDIRAVLRGLAAGLRAGIETGAYDADQSEVLTSTVKKTLSHLSPAELQRLYEAFGLGSRNPAGDA